MATVLGGDAVDAPVSIYFDLEQGALAELEIVAEAAIAWSGALKAIIAEVEPGITVRIQLFDGDEGSLWLNTVLSFLESQIEQLARGAERFPRLIALARGLALIVVATPLQVTAESIWNALVQEQPEVQTLSPESQKQILAAFDRVISERIAEDQRDRFARAVVKDTRIRAVGVSGKPDKRPGLTVARDTMTAYLDRERTEQEEDQVQRRVVTLRVTLVSPVLENAERSWRFREPGMPEFGAVMRDKGFLDAIGRHAVHQELQFGIPMVIEVEFKERFDSGQWVPVERSVIRVIEPKVDRGELPF